MHFNNHSKPLPRRGGHVPCVDSTIHFYLKGETHTRVIQPKVSVVGQRIRTLKDLFYQTFVGELVPQGIKPRFDLYDAAKPYFRDLGKKGGTDYTRALTRVKFAWAGLTERERARSHSDAISAVIPRR